MKTIYKNKNTSVALSDTHVSIVHVDGEGNGVKASFEITELVMALIKLTEK